MRGCRVQIGVNEVVENMIFATNMQFPFVFFWVQLFIILLSIMVIIRTICTMNNLIFL